MDEHLNENQAAVQQKEPRRGGFWSEIVKFTFITLIIVIPFRIYVAQPFIVSGASMDPTFADGQYLIVDQISKDFEEPKRESVIIFKYPKDTSKYFIKRVIGLPYETVQISEGKVTIINKDHPKGFTLNEPYIDPKNEKMDDFQITLGPREFFVLGDNRLGSFDSRSWGPVPENLIVGRPLLRVLPANDFNFLPGDYSR